MKTDELIADLSRDPPRNTLLTSSAMVIGAAVLSLIAALMLSMLWLKPRGDLAIPLLVENHVFLLKLIFTVSVAVGILPIVCDLCVPGRRIKTGPLLAAMPFAVIMVLTLRDITDQYVGGFAHDVDRTWLECLWQIPALAAPAFIILVITVRRLAPTNLSLTGAYIGLLAGGIGAIGYALHCHHDSVAFIGIGYTLAIIEVAVLGILLGPRLLRWEIGVHEYHRHDS